MRLSATHVTPTDLDSGFDPPAARAPMRHLLLVALLLSQISNDCRADQHQERLAEVRRQLEIAKSDLERDTGSLGQAREQSFRLAKAITEAEQRQPEYLENINAKRAQVKRLNAERRGIEAGLDGAKQRLLKNTRHAYALSMQPRMKVLLNQNDASDLARTMAYYDYTRHKYRKAFEQIKTASQALANAAAALKTEAQELQALSVANKARLDQLTAAKEEQAGMLAAIQQRMKNGNTAIAQLKLDEQRLRELVKQFDKPTASAPTEPPNPTKQPAEFRDAKGSFQWPAAGRVAKAPGTALRAGGARWAGVLIDGEPGTPVQAIADGKIVFADWFRNLGKLVIIDHGGGYMSLYGNNAELHKKPGDSVNAGDNIASVGAGTGDIPAGVYFELRERGEPIDPRAWFARR